MAEYKVDEILKNTIIESKLITQDEKRKLLSRLREEKLINTRKNSKKIIGIDCSNLDKENDKILKILNNIDKDGIQNAIERWEYDRNYKYSAIWKYDNLSIDKLHELISEEKAVEFELNFDYLSSVYHVPTVLKLNNEYVFKFSKIIKDNSDTLEVKYPALVIFYTDINIIEIRVSSLNSNFKTNNDIYAKEIDQISSWIKSYLKVNLSEINFEKIINNIIEKDNQTEIYSRWINSHLGGYARLKVPEDNRYILPLIGELESLMESHIKLFNSNLEIKGLLDDFIEKIKEDKEYPRSAICWKNDDNTADYIIEFIHNYKGRNYTVLSHYYNNNDLEMMNDVTRNIIHYNE